MISETPLVLWFSNCGYRVLSLLLIKVFIVLDYNWIRSKIILNCSLDILSLLSVYLYSVWSFFFFFPFLSKNSFQKAQLNLLLSCSEYLPVPEYSKDWLAYPFAGVACLEVMGDGKAWRLPRDEPVQNISGWRSPDSASQAAHPQDSALQVFLVYDLEPLGLNFSSPL